MSSDPGQARRQAPGERTLKHALIEAALEILQEEGLERLTLRRVAARVGVSHAAPAHHFRGMAHLLGCLCRIGFCQLTHHMEMRRDAVGCEPRARLLAVCDGYVEFARENPGLSELMFHAGKEKVEKAAFGDTGQRAYGVLKEACAPFVPVGPEADSTETMIWSLIHGFAFLELGGRFDNPGRATPRPSVRHAIPPLKLRDGR